MFCQQNEVCKRKNRFFIHYKPIFHIQFFLSRQNAPFSEFKSQSYTLNNAQYANLAKTKDTDETEFIHNLISNLFFTLKYRSLAPICSLYSVFLFIRKALTLLFSCLDLLLSRKRNGFIVSIYAKCVKPGINMLKIFLKKSTLVVLVFVYDEKNTFTGHHIVLNVLWCRKFNLCTLSWCPICE